MTPSMSRAAEIAARGLEAERADQAHALGDRDGERRIAASAARDQHGRVGERIAGRDRRNGDALLGERGEAAQHRGVERAHAQCRTQPRDEARRHCGRRDREGCGRRGIGPVDHGHDGNERTGLLGERAVDRVGDLVVRIGRRDDDSRRLGLAERRAELSRAHGDERGRGAPERIAHSSCSIVGDDDDRTR